MRWLSCLLSVALPNAVLAQQPAGMIVLHKLTGPDNQAIYVNPQAIVSLRAPRSADTAGPHTRCVIHTVDGKFIAVIQTCESFIIAQDPHSP